MIPESPAPEEENVEFEDIAMALIQEEELKQEVSGPLRGGLVGML